MPSAPDSPAPRRKGPPLQLVIMLAIVGSLMLIIWFKLSSPVFSESQKARNTALYFIEAIAQAPIEKTGQELHPEVRRHFNRDTLPKRFQELGLQSPNLTIVAWHNERYVSSPLEWRWRVDVRNAQQLDIPLLVSVRMPEQMSLGRRWRLYSLCRPDLDLRRKSWEALSQSEELAEVRASGFEANQTAAWPLVGYDPLQISIPGTDGRRLLLAWEATPAEQLNCDYTLQAKRLQSAE